MLTRFLLHAKRRVKRQRIGADVRVEEGIGQPGFDNLGFSDMGASGGAEEQAQGYKGSGRDLKLLKHVL